MGVKNMINMKSKLIGAILMLTVFFISSTYAINYNEIEYHCPSFNDINYKRGQFTAATNYNSVQMNWYSLTSYPEAYLSPEEFKFTNSYNDCVGGTCEIYCVYKIRSGQDMLKLFVSRQEYRFVRGIKGPWNNGMCESSRPEDCTFAVVKDSWW